MKVFVGVVALIVVGVLGLWGMPVEAAAPGKLAEPVVQVEVEALSPSGEPGPIIAIAECPEGTVLTGGGYRTTHALDAPLHSNRPDGNAWRAGAAKINTSGQYAITAYALCATVQ